MSGAITALPDPVEAFIARWQNADGTELANAQSFVRELCVLLDVPVPDPARADTADNAYVFERRIVFRHGDGGSSEGRIDCYRRGAFVLEAKKLRLKPGVGADGTVSKGFDDALLRARSQAENYARALPAAESRPPFVVVVDVGNVIELYAEFSRSGATYTPFPDPRSHRLRLADLHDEAVRARLRAVWLAPLSLDPATTSARVTRDIAAHLAEVAKSLEQAGHAAETVAGFLTRCLFSMFAEDVGLIPKASFTELLHSLKDDTAQFVPLVGALWQEMDVGGFSVVLRKTLPRFNGKLFKQPDVLPLTKAQIALLLEASKADWTQVEPAIFGTLLERALDPLERHALGAHYTPRAYVERLVQPTVIEPLRQSWAYVQGAAVLLASEGKQAAAIAEVRAFHHRLCTLRVLDPACGSGNFLYVALEHLKRLEGEVLNQLHELGEGQAQLETEGFAVDPHQFLGLELNPRAAAIAELVLWIGYLQWHFRISKGNSGASLPNPILRDFRNIECRDAVLAHEGIDHVLDDQGMAVSRWDGRSMKKHAVTGEQVPDETARVALERYRNPRQAEWPAADVVVGNPPFIGNKRMRTALGDGYVDALRGVWPAVPESADFVMFWWHHAAQLVAQGKLARFGFITTNSLTQTFSRRVVQGALDQGLHLAFAISDHPWVDSADGAAVRIAMTVAAPGAGEGRLCSVTAEREGKGEGLEVELTERSGLIHADLSVGANVATALPLLANGGLSNRGMIPHGEGFLVTPEEGAALDGGALLRPYRNGRDLTDRPRDVLVVDTFGLSETELRQRYPATWQWLHDRVKPARDHNPRESRRKNWWLFGENQPRMRASVAGLPRYIATAYVAKHRIFQFLDTSILPDDMLIAVALNDAYCLGVLSSRVHVVWALAAGGTLEDRPRYTKTTCFETFPFPVATAEQQARIRDLAEQIDAHRKRVLAAHAELTLTGLYNVLARVGAGDTANATPLNAKEKAIHEKGLVAVLKSLHEELDAAVLDAYGWHDLIGQTGDEQTMLERLVALNTQRRAEEAQGHIRWLRPEFQNPQAAQAAIGLESGGSGRSSVGKLEKSDEATSPPVPARTPTQQAWPQTLPDQLAAVARILADTPATQTETQLAAHFTGKGRWKSRLPDILAALEALGRARRLDDGRWMG
ncbi:MAG: DNA methyltransferase [Pseudomonadota bacterium]